MADRRYPECCIDQRQIRVGLKERNVLDAAPAVGHGDRDRGRRLVRRRAEHDRRLRGDIERHSFKRESVNLLLRNDFLATA